jgi:hypothetical protein
MKRRRAAALLVTVAAIVTLLVVAPPILLPDKPAPASVAGLIDAARHSIWTNANDAGPIVHLQFVEARCSSDGSVILLFDEWRPPYLRPTHGFAMGGMTNDGWGFGGTGHDDWTEIESEIAFNVGDDQLPCS